MSMGESGMHSSKSCEVSKCSKIVPTDGGIFVYEGMMADLKYVHFIRIKCREWAGSGVPRLT